LSVLTLSPDWEGISDGAITVQGTPILSKWRAIHMPHPPAS
jgi:hypothetical protein